MLPHRHFLISAAVGVAGWAVTRNRKALPLAIVSGTLPDLDHGADYAWYGLTGAHRLLLPLHGYEWCAPLFLWSHKRWGGRLATVVVISYLCHLLADQVENQTKPGGYFFLYRLWHRFTLNRISRDPAAGTRGRMDDIERLKKLAAKLGLRF
ncbi:MAG: hypothetical protein R3A44_02685 [Caldilineaceae bacterium]